MARHAHQHGGRRGLLRDTGGSVSAEAVIMLPVFILIWTLLVYLGYGYKHAIDQGAIARRDAWAHVMNNCDGAVPATTVVSDATSGAFGPIEDLFRVIDSVLAILPFFRDYWPGFIPDEKQFVRNSAVAKPELLGGGTASTHYSIVLMCNERQIDVNLDDLSNQAWGTLVHF